MNERELTGYPSIDKPWQQYYSEEALHAPLPGGSMYDYMAACNADRLEKTALNYFGRKFSYSELIREIDRAAAAFCKIGISSGTVVMTFALNTPECIVSVYALNRLGAIVDLQYADQSPREALENLQLTQARFILTADTFLPLVQDTLELGNFGTSVQVITIPAARSLPPLKRLFFPMPRRSVMAENILSFDDILVGLHDPIPPGEADAPALIVHTSGTTGVPKGVLLSNKNVNAVAVEYKNSLLELKPGDSILNIAPPFVAFGICLAIHTPLCLGMQVCLSPSPDPETNGKTFFFYKPVHFLGGPAHIRSIVQTYKRQSLSFVRTIGYGGEAISSEDAERYVSFFKDNGAPISHLAPGYGMTEFGGTVVTTGSAVWKEGSVGIPLPLTNVKIVDPDRWDELPCGKTGEIWMTSPSLMHGYYRDTDEDGDGIVIDESGTRWLRTGDLGELDQDGFLYLRGRIKRIYLAKGRNNSIYKLFPDRVERVIRECPHVLECAVVVKSADGIFHVPVAFAAVQECTVDQIQRYCKDHLPEYMIPEDIRTIDHIPHTVTGKVDYHLLESLVEEESRQCLFLYH